MWPRGERGTIPSEFEKYIMVPPPYGGGGPSKMARPVREPKKAPERGGQTPRGIKPKGNHGR